MEAGRLSVGEFAFPGPLRDQLDLAHAIGEGEGCASVAGWRAGHEAFWHSAEMREFIGDPSFTVHDDTLAVATEFRLVAGEEDLDLAALLRQARAAAGAR
jgi:hypothetical protein